MNKNRTKITKNIDFSRKNNKKMKNFYQFLANSEFSRDFYVFAGMVNIKFSKIKLTKVNFSVGIVCFPVAEFSGDYALVQGASWDFLLMTFVMF